MTVGVISCVYLLSIMHVPCILLDIVVQMVKNLPAMQETPIQFLGQEVSLEEGTATHSSILAWRIPMDGGPWGSVVHGVAKSRTRLSN